MSEVYKYYGKYRGTVQSNIDPEQRGRLLVTVPDVLGNNVSSWAMPCLPLAGTNTGFYTTPSNGAGVWIEFEQGDPNYPVWVGCFWGTAAEVPALARSVPPTVPGITLQTVNQNGIVISDVPGPTGGIRIQIASGAAITITDAGIFLSNGQGAMISLSGRTVDINGGALTIT
jgi:uncharacterized protein involved in type VI secretion and phage assembly